MAVHGLEHSEVRHPLYQPRSAPAPQLRATEDTAEQPPPRKAEAVTPPEEQAQRNILAEHETPDAVTHRARFQVDAETGRIVVQLLNEKREVVRQIPPEEMLEVSRRLREVQGLLFDERF